MGEDGGGWGGGGRRGLLTGLEAGQGREDRAVWVVKPLSLDGYIICLLSTSALGTFRRQRSSFRTLLELLVSGVSVFSFGVLLKPAF